MILTTLVVAVFLGIGAQIVAERLRLPAILPLLVLGIVAGPQMTGLITPGSLGEVLEVGIHLGVAVILFEGGLSLDLGQLRRVGGAVRNLLSIGLVVTGVAAALVARLVTGMPLSSAALFGAIVTVTGPTVIVPLLRHMIAPRRVKTVLVSEGLIIDPIGAVLAYLVLQWIERAGVPLGELVGELLALSAFGAGVGFIAGSLGNAFAKSRPGAGALRNLTVLALVLVCYQVAEVLSPQSGILATVVMGITMSAARIPDLEPLRAFKEQLTTLLISVLFILLAAQLDLGVIRELGLRGAVVAVAMILVVRPLAVLLSVMPSQLSGKERIVLALTAPRGIVAAAVASLAARELERTGMAGGAVLEGLVYLVILVTGLWATVMAVVLPRLLGFLDDPSRRRAVLVGGHALSRTIARTLEAQGRHTVVIDVVPLKLEPARREGLTTVRGDARDAATYERAGVEPDTAVLAMTTNDELNLLAAELVHTEFGVAHPVVALQVPSAEFGSLRRAWMDLLGGHPVDVPAWIRRVEADGVELPTVALTGEEIVTAVLELLEESPEDVVAVCGWQGSEPVFRFEGKAPFEASSLARFDRLTLMVASGTASERLEALAGQAAEEEPPEEAAEDGDGEDALVPR